MAKVSGSELSRIKAELDSAKHEELRFLVPKETAAKFREVAETTKMTTVELFEEMVETHALGMDLKTRSK